VRRRTLAAAAVGSIVIAVTAAAYLRDPPWLIGVSSGFARSRDGRHGRPYRWIGGRASFFVAANARLVHVPLRTPHGSDEPVVVRIDLNDRPTAMVALRDASWTEATVAVPPAAAGGRRVVRVDLHVDRTWGPLSQGVQVGDVSVE
jgi:hypothetical protein